MYTSADTIHMKWIDMELASGLIKYKVIINSDLIVDSVTDIFAQESFDTVDDWSQLSITLQELSDLYRKAVPQNKEKTLYVLALEKLASRIVNNQYGPQPMLMMIAELSRFPLGEVLSISMMHNVINILQNPTLTAKYPDVFVNLLTPELLFANLPAAPYWQDYCLQLLSAVDIHANKPAALSKVMENCLEQPPLNIETEESYVYYLQTTMENVLSKANTTTNKKKEFITNRISRSIQLAIGTFQTNPRLAMACLNEIFILLNEPYEITDEHQIYEYSVTQLLPLFKVESMRRFVIDKLLIIADSVEIYYSMISIAEQLISIGLHEEAMDVLFASGASRPESQYHKKKAGSLFYVLAEHYWIKYKQKYPSATYRGLDDNTNVVDQNLKQLRRIEVLVDNSCLEHTEDTLPLSKPMHAKLLVLFADIYEPKRLVTQSKTTSANIRRAINFLLPNIVIKPSLVQLIQQRRESYYQRAWQFMQDLASNPINQLDLFGSIIRDNKMATPPGLTLKELLENSRRELTKNSTYPWMIRIFYLELLATNKEQARKEMGGLLDKNDRTPNAMAAKETLLVHYIIEEDYLSAYNIFTQISLLHTGSLFNSTMECVKIYMPILLSRNDWDIATNLAISSIDNSVLIYTAQILLDQSQPYTDEADSNNNRFTNTQLIENILNLLNQLKIWALTEGQVVEYDDIINIVYKLDPSAAEVFKQMLVDKILEQGFPVYELNDHQYNIITKLLALLRDDSRSY